MKILMCKPSHYDIDYEINAWMNKRIKADTLKAAVQWKKLHDTIAKLGAQIELIEPQPGWPDMVFTANAGLARDNKVLLSEFRYPERQGEKHYFKQWFIKAGFDILDTDPQTSEYFFEGEGDALFVKDTLFAGYGLRSDRAYYCNAEKLFEGAILYCELVDPYFYHLDTCFSPINGEIGIWWPEAFTKDSQKSMSEHLELLAIPEAEAKQFACNAVVIENNVIIPSGCYETQKLLEANGFKVYSCDMSEFIKSGGACKCLTMFI